ncbi:hypothetical protein D9M69_460980 [compost metagenome]
MLQNVGARHALAQMLLVQVLDDGLLPHIGLVALILLSREHLGLVALHPPGVAGPVTHHCLGPQLIAIRPQALYIDLGASDRPIPAVAGVVLQVFILVGRADEHALPRHVQHAPPVALAVGVHRGREELLGAGRLSLVEGVQFAQLDDPLAPDRLIAVLVAQVEWRIHEPLSAEH